MKISVLASGSSGNSTYVETSKYKILIDLGMSVRYINEALVDFNISIEDIDYILITHLHEDHTRTISSFSKNKKATFLITSKMYKELMKKNSELNYQIYDNSINLDNLNILAINTSHDSVDARGFVISENGSSLVYITDTGYLNTKYFDTLKDKNLYIMESNHDPIKLREGKYPLYLQRRILSDRGHLSNELSATYLSKLIGPNTRKVILAHLSKENNTEDIALETFKNKMLENNIDFENVVCARPNEKTEVVNI